MIFQTFVYSITCIFLLVILIDFINLGKDWFLRIKIGRFKNYSTWNQAIISKGKQWINHTPKIRVTDNTRLIMFDILRGNFSNNTIQHWQEAALLLGLAESAEKDEKLQGEIMTYLDQNFNEEGNWRKKPLHVDGAILAYALLKLNFIQIDKYRPALDYTWKLILDHIGEDGTVQYRKANKTYRYVDTIGFICPFLITYGLRYQKDECISLAYKQIMEYKKHGLIEKSFLPCHAYDINNKLPLGLFGWGRGLGWFGIGLMDAWNELPGNHKYKKELEQIVVSFSSTIRQFQQENGSWNSTVTRNESRADSSATATLAWFLLNAHEINECKEENWLAAERAINYLMKVTRRDGGIDFSQGDTKDIGVYSSMFNIMPFTQGFAIRSMTLYMDKVRSGTRKIKIVS
jgi:unsaturated rhamnogalacturonyl hydrolase